jgi:hypothetical protein
MQTYTKILNTPNIEPENSLITYRREKHNLVKGLCIPKKYPKETHLAHVLFLKGLVFPQTLNWARLCFCK